MTIVTRRFTTTGMHCPSCSTLIQMDLKDVAGVSGVTSDHRTGVTEVTYDDSLTGSEQIVAAVMKAGYGAELAGE
ncbi:MAG: heavy-metal-associated domain-containing protein [Coriobacteriia bacterium]|nr:heavy-metal-associated domain-containing protein [Coriobacteriia bacterium]